MNIDMVCASVFLISIGIISLHLTRRYLGWRKLRSIDTKRIADIAPGLVKISGRVRSKGEGYLVCPIKKRTCLMYYVHIYIISQEPAPGFGLYKGTIKKIRRGRSFLLCDDTGCVEIVPGKNVMGMVNVSDNYHRSKRLSSEEYGRIIPRFGIRLWDLFGLLDRKLVVEESILKEGTKLHIIGKVRKNRDKSEGSPQYVIRPDRKLRISQKEGIFKEPSFLDELFAKYL